MSFSKVASLVKHSVGFSGTFYKEWLGKAAGLLRAGHVRPQPWTRAALLVSASPFALPSHPLSGCEWCSHLRSGWAWSRFTVEIPVESQVTTLRGARQDDQRSMTQGSCFTFRLDPWLPEGRFLIGSRNRWAGLLRPPVLRGLRATSRPAPLHLGCQRAPRAGTQAGMVPPES